MLLLVTIVHLIVAILLVTFVLLQDSKGGGVFGMSGGSNQILSSTGAANFLVCFTRWLAVLFAVTCILLTILTSKKSSDSVVDDYVPPAATTPAAGTPANGAAATDPKAATDAGAKAAAPTDAATPAPAKSDEKSGEKK